MILHYYSLLYYYVASWLDNITFIQDQFCFVQLALRKLQGRNIQKIKMTFWWNYLFQRESTLLVCSKCHPKLLRFTVNTFSFTFKKRGLLVHSFCFDIDAFNFSFLFLWLNTRTHPFVVNYLKVHSANSIYKHPQSKHVDVTSLLISCALISSVIISTFSFTLTKNGSAFCSRKRLNAPFNISFSFLTFFPQFISYLGVPLRLCIFVWDLVFFVLSSDITSSGINMEIVAIIPHF